MIFLFFRFSIINNRLIVKIYKTVPASDAYKKRLNNFVIEVSYYIFYDGKK